MLFSFKYMIEKDKEENANSKRKTFHFQNVKIAIDKHNIAKYIRFAVCIGRLFSI